MAKIELDDITVNKLVGKRVAQFTKTIRTLEGKLERRDKQVHKLKREVELLKAQLMSEDSKQVAEISKVARHLVTLMQEANWVDKYYECGEEYTADDD